MKNLFFLTISLILISFFQSDIPGNNTRNGFEAFILKKFNQFPAVKGANGEFDAPDQAEIQDFMMTFDPASGDVPTDRRFTALQKTLISERYRNGDIFWSNVPCNMGGRTRCIQFDPNDPTGRKVYAGAVTGGLWYNNNIFDSLSPWQSVDDFWPNLSISCIAFNPLNPKEIYIGTGEAQTAVFIYRESSGRGCGIYKSSDGGLSWQLMNSTKDFAYITDIVFRTEKGHSVIYAGIASGKYKGIDHLSQPSDGLYRSEDSGQTWTQVLPVITGFSTPYVPADIETGQNQRLIVSTMNNINGNGGCVILYSDSGTAGTWQKFEQIRNTVLADGTYPVPGRTMIASAPSNRNIIYAIVGAGYITPEGYRFSYGRYVYRSDNNGANWYSRTNPVDSSGRKWASLAWHAFTLAVDPKDANTLYVGGLDVYKSMNSGYSWSRVSDWIKMYYQGGDDFIHADIHSLIYKKNQSDTLLITTDGGVFVTTNASAQYPVFRPQNNHFNTLQYYTCDIHPQKNTNYFLGGLQDNGTIYCVNDEINLSNMITGGDGAYCFFDQDEPEFFLTSYYYNHYYFFQNGAPIGQNNDPDYGIFINPSDINSKLNVMWSNGISMAGGPDQLIYYYDIHFPLAGIKVNPGTQTTVPYSHIRVSPNSPDNSSTLFLGTMAGRLYKLKNAESSKELSEIGSNQFPFGAISCVAVGGSDDTLLVTFSNYGVNSVWYTVNGGISWESREGNLPDMPVRWAIFHPKNSWQVMLATETGIWTTDSIQNQDLTWNPVNTGLANVRVDMLKVRKSDLTVLAATHGRGLFTATFPHHPKPVGIYELKTGPYIFVSGRKLYFEGLQAERITIYNLNGKLVLDQDVTGKRTIDLENINSGTYIVSWISGKNRRVEKIIVY